MRGWAIPSATDIALGLFIDSLAFEQAAAGHEVNERLGILAGSLLPVIVGHFFLKATLPAAND